MSEANLHRSVEAAKYLRNHVAFLVAGDGASLSDDDKQAIQDTFDGETNLEDEIRSAVLAMEEDEIMVTGIKAREEALAGRRARLEKRIEVTRGLIEQAMVVAEWPSLKLDIATLSIRDAAPKVVIDDEAAIPTQFFTRADPKLDKAGLGRVLKERHKALTDADAAPDEAARAAALAKVEESYPAIPGVQLQHGHKSLTIRSK